MHPRTGGSSRPFKISDGDFLWGSAAHGPQRREGSTRPQSARMGAARDYVADLAARAKATKQGRESHEAGLSSQSKPMGSSLNGARTHSRPATARAAVGNRLANASPSKTSAATAAEPKPELNHSINSPRLGDTSHERIKPLFQFRRPTTLSGTGLAEPPQTYSMKRDATEAGTNRRHRPTSASRLFSNGVPPTSVPSMGTSATVRGESSPRPKDSQTAHSAKAAAAASSLKASQASGSGPIDTQQIRQSLAECRSTALLVIESSVSRLRQHHTTLSNEIKVVTAAAARQDFDTIRPQSEANLAWLRRVVSVCSWLASDEKPLRHVINSEIADLAQRSGREQGLVWCEPAGSEIVEVPLPMVAAESLLRICTYCLDGVRLAAACVQHSKRNPHDARPGSSADFGPWAADDGNENAEAHGLRDMVDKWCDEASVEATDASADVVYLTALACRIRKNRDLLCKRLGWEEAVEGERGAALDSALKGLLPVYWEWAMAAHDYFRPSKRKYASAGQQTSNPGASPRGPHPPGSRPSSAGTTPSAHSAAQQTPQKPTFGYPPQQQAGGSAPVGQSTGFRRFRRPDSAKDRHRYEQSTHHQRPPRAPTDGHSSQQPHHNYRTASGVGPAATLVNPAKRLIAELLADEAAWVRHAATLKNPKLAQSSGLEVVALPTVPWPTRTLDSLASLLQQGDTFTLSRADVLLAEEHRRTPDAIPPGGVAGLLKALQRRWHPDRFSRSTASGGGGGGGAPSAQVVAQATKVAQRINELKEQL